MSDKKATIYHNKRCGTSRKVLQYLEDEEFDLDVILYMDANLTKEDFLELISRLENKELILRKKEESYKKLDKKPESDQEVAALLAQNPRVMERPIVIFGENGIVARPLEFLENWINNKRQ